MFEPQLISMITENFGISIYMVLMSTVFSYLFGLPLGVILRITSDAAFKPGIKCYCKPAAFGSVPDSAIPDYAVHTVCNRLQFRC